MCVRVCVCARAHDCMRATKTNKQRWFITLILLRSVYTSVFRDPEGEGGGKEVGDMFKRTTSAPAPASMLSEKEEIDNIFKAVRRNSLNRKVDMQWQGRAIENTFRYAVI